MLKTFPRYPQVLIYILYINVRRDFCLGLCWAVSISSGLLTGNAANYLSFAVLYVMKNLLCVIMCIGHSRFRVELLLNPARAVPGLFLMKTFSCRHFCSITCSVSPPQSSPQEFAGLTPKNPQFFMNNHCFRGCGHLFFFFHFGFFWSGCSYTVRICTAVRQNKANVPLLCLSVRSIQGQWNFNLNYIRPCDL